MAIARQARAITFSAVNDVIDLGDLVEIVGMSFQGTGLTASQRVRVFDGSAVAGGNVLVDYLVEGTADNADLWVGRKPQPVRYLNMPNSAIGGTWVLTVFVNQ